MFIDECNIFQQDECFCEKRGLEVAHAIKVPKKKKKNFFQIRLICQLLPFVRVGQNCDDFYRRKFIVILRIRNKVHLQVELL